MSKIKVKDIFQDIYECGMSDDVCVWTTDGSTRTSWFITLVDNVVIEIESAYQCDGDTDDELIQRAPTYEEKAVIEAAIKDWLKYRAALTQEFN